MPEIVREKGIFLVFCRSIIRKMGIFWVENGKNIA
jgi:hypothetical protein